MSTLEKQLQKLIDQQSPRIARAFKLAVRNVTDNVTLNRVVMALRRGDIEAAVDALGVTRAAFSPIVEPLTAAYTKAGNMAGLGTTWQTPTGRAKFRFDLANPSASRFISEYSSSLVTRIAEDSRAALRVAIQQGYDQGRGPLDIARDLVGRKGPTGRRTGGLVGLSEPQSRAVQNMRARLSSGDPSEFKKVLNLTRRDKRLDGIIKRAIEQEKPISAADIDKLTGRYSDRLLTLRGETIARTETATAVETARMDNFRDGMQQAGVPDWAVEREWVHGGGRKDPRGDHVAYSGEKVTGVDTPFVLPSGARMMHPHDTSLGAGAADIVNCTCRQLVRVRYDLIQRAELGGVG